MRPDNHMQLRNNCLHPFSFYVFVFVFCFFGDVASSEYFCAITAFSLNGEYVVRFPLPGGVFLPCDHDLIFGINLRENSINRSINQWLKRIIPRTPGLETFAPASMTSVQVTAHVRITPLRYHLVLEIKSTGTQTESMSTVPSRVHARLQNILDKYRSALSRAMTTLGGAVHEIIESTQKSMMISLYVVRKIA